MAAPVVSSSPRGALFGRYVKSLLIARGDLVSAAAYAASQNGGWSEVASALKSAVAPLDSSDVLAPVIATDMAEALRPLTVLGRMSGTRRVPFLCRMFEVAGGASAAWFGEGRAIPATSLDFNQNVALGLAKVGAISLYTSELARSSTPGIESTIASDAIKAIAYAVDLAFLDPENSGLAGIRPASILYGAPSVSSTGSDIAAIDHDLKLLVAAVGDSDLSTAYFVTRPQTAAYLGTLRGTGGAAAFPGIGPRGGALLGVPVLCSNAVQADSDSPGEYFIGLICASEIAVADDGVASVDVSTETSIQSSDTPSESDGSAAVHSTWQNDLVALKIQREINWRRRHATSAAYLDGVQF